MKGRTRKPPDPRETEWIRGARDGDRAAFDALSEAHGRVVLRFLDGLCGNHADAEDLAQETLLRAFRGLGTFREGSDFRAWLLSIAYYEWVHSKRRKRRVVVRDPETLDAAAPDSEGPASELEVAVRSSVEQLPEDQRAVVLLRFGAGLSHAEIASITKAPEPTVRGRLFRARQALRRVLAAWSPGKANE